MVDWFYPSESKVRLKKYHVEGHDGGKLLTS